MRFQNDVEMAGSNSSDPMLDALNWWGAFATLAGLAIYLLTVRYLRHFLHQRAGCLIAFGMSVPAGAYVAYYSGLFGEPIWLYQVRSIPGSEFLAAPAGILAGWVQLNVIPSLTISATGRRLMIPALLLFALSIPYAKPLLRPLSRQDLRDEWTDEVCLQSTISTCGPASAATIVRQLGGALTEAQLAKEAFTSRSGTENWYLTRALRNHGYEVAFALANPAQATLPAIGGVRLKSLDNSGHFIALLQRDGKNVIFADPMLGRRTNLMTELTRTYEFTGLIMSIGRSKERTTTVKR